MQRTYKYRLYPTDKQAVKLLGQLTLCRRLYNAALNQRIWAHQRGLKVGLNDQHRQLTVLKAAMPEYKNVYSHTLQDVLKRLDKTYANFFRRCKEKRPGKKGFPKFKSRLRYRSLTYPDSENGSYAILDPTHLKVSKIGVLRFFQHRPIPAKGVIKTMTLKHDPVGDWHVTFSVELPDPVPVVAKTENRVGVDVGLKNLAVVSSGEFFKPPKFLVKGLDGVKTLQRALARCVKGSKNREKLRIRLAKANRKIERQRDDYLHKISRYLVDTYDTIVFEKLQITNMVKNHHLARAILDAAWGKLQQLTAYKAENAGKQALFGNPNGTTCTCHWCGARQQISLADRIFSCRTCGHSTDRDWNAALNIRESVRPDWAELLKNARRGETSMPDIPWMNGVSLAREAGSPAL